jgi:penicillin amidase
VVGEVFSLGRHPAAGSRETPNKAGHGFVRGRFDVTFGAMAPHVSDMADDDANWFTLWGGQDGWLGSAAFLDQVPRWLEGRAIRAPRSRP